MMDRLIRWCVTNPLVVAMICGSLSLAAISMLRNLPVDALPDLSDVQVIIRTSYPGQAPQVVEDQVTFPLTTALRSIPGAVGVRGFSSFGDSLVYVLFKDGTEPSAARARISEQLAQLGATLPRRARVSIGPAATGVGWVYEYALTDPTGRHDLSELRALQDWNLRYALQSVEGVAEVATVGGMVQQTQVVLDPALMRAQHVTLDEIRAAVTANNNEAGGGALEMGGAEYIVRAGGYLTSQDDLRAISMPRSDRRTPLLLGELAAIGRGPEPRRGVADLDGAGEAVGGLVVMRAGYNASEVIAGLKKRLAVVANSLPEGVRLVEVYDRSVLIDRAIDNLRTRLIEEFVLVVLVCALFLLHLRSSLVPLVVLPLSILFAFWLLRVQGVNANIMSLAGIAIAIGAMLDAAIVMLENTHKRMEGLGSIDRVERERVVIQACSEVAPALFISLLVAALSFVPGLVLQGQEGKLFSPLILTKTYVMLVAAVLSVTLVPVLILACVRGRVRPEQRNPINRIFARGYRAALGVALDKPWLAIMAGAVFAISSCWPLARLQSEFMPSLDEGDLLYMPTSAPAISVSAASALLQEMDRSLAEVPEVERVFGKAGRGETATDPAPLEMFETLVKLKPRDQWRPEMTPEGLRSELDAKVRFPGIANYWTYPIKGRLDMLATGVRTSLGIKIQGPDVGVVAATAVRVEALLRSASDRASVYAERTANGRFVQIDIDRDAASRAGVSVADIHDVVELGIGGQAVSERVSGRERYPIVLRYPFEWRDSPETLRDLPFVNRAGSTVRLGDVARVSITSGPSMIRSEDSRPLGIVYINLNGGNAEAYVARAKELIGSSDVLPRGYTIEWVGEHQYYERSIASLKAVTPLVLLIIVLLLWITFRSAVDLALILATLPVVLSGGLWLVWMLGFNLSIAVAVGFIALAGLAVETSVVMLLFLNQAWASRRERSAVPAISDLHGAIVEGALLRLRPKLMTVGTIVLSLMPMMMLGGVGSEITRRIAAPMVGGMLTSAVAILLIVPPLFLVAHRRHVKAGATSGEPLPPPPPTPT